MVQKNPFLKYLIKDKKEDVFHTSGYAKAQNGDNIGAASAESYAVRVNINQNRKRIRNYSDSRLVAGARMNAPKAKVYEPPKMDTGALASGTNSATARAAMPVKNSGISFKK